MHISFDIFDTLITRRTWNPKGTFLIMQQKIGKLCIGEYITNNFASIRVEAENNARHWNAFCGKGEITLDDIYNEIMDMSLLNRDQIELIKEMEVEVEKNSVIPIKRNIDILKNMLANRHNVILISDMYLDERTIRSFLVAFDDVFETIPIYVSSEYGMTKQKGDLYLEVQKAEGIKNGEWIHYGDDDFSDVKLPQLMGIVTKKVLACNMMPWERFLYNKYSIDEDVELQLYLGITKCIRLNNEMNQFEEIGASLGSIVFYSFCSWIIDECKKAGVLRLLFVARDGYLIKKMVDAIIKKRDIDISTKYIYGSRDAWNPTEDSNKSMKSCLIGYFKQEIDNSFKDTAFVDIQGTGKSIEVLLNTLGIEDRYLPIRVFCFDYFREIANTRCQYMYYFSDRRCDICESLSRAPHGKTNGYEKKNGQYYPKFLSGDEIEWERSGIEDYAKYAVLFVEHMEDLLSKEQITISSKKYSRVLLQYSKECPDAMVYSFIADMPHGEIIDGHEQKYAPKLLMKDMLGKKTKCDYKELYSNYRGNNLEYSIKGLSRDEKEIIHRFEKKKMIEAIERNNSIECTNNGYRKIIIYGAGKKGIQLFIDIANKGKDYVVGIVDINSDTFINEEYDVMPISWIKTIKYEYIIVTAGDDKQQGIIKKMLCCNGINSEKIMLLSSYIGNE